MNSINIVETETKDKDLVRDFVIKHWGAKEVAVHNTLYLPHEFPGFWGLVNGKRLGLITYRIQNKECEIITLNSEVPGSGLGSALIDGVLHQAKKSGCQRLWLITTNDNLNALGFYQKRGFRIVKIHCDAVIKSRLLKPQIPEIGDHNIPIRDEIELEMRWD